MKEKLSKEKKMEKVLLGCTEHYLRTGKPVGSNTLKESGFTDISSATIRNYFASLEEAGYLTQPHTSGGRIPTEKALRLYVEETQGTFAPSDDMRSLLGRSGIDITNYLQEALQWLSNTCDTSAFLSSPRFDQDYVIGIRAVSIDAKKILFAINTQFGQVFTEVLPLDQKLTHLEEKKMESYFQWRLHGSREEERPHPQDPLHEELYKELMLRYIVSSAHFAQDEVMKAGLAKLLKRMVDPALITASFGLFENPKSLRFLLREIIRKKNLTFWIGKDLEELYPGTREVALLALPYNIGPKAVGAIALIGPVRSPYRTWIEVLTPFAELLSKNLTQAIYKHKLSYREPNETTHLLTGAPKLLN